MENRLVFSRPPQQIFVLQVQKFLNGKLQKVKRNLEKGNWLVNFTLKSSQLYQHIFVNSVANIYYGVCCVLCIHLSVVVGAFMKWKYL